MQQFQSSTLFTIVTMERNHLNTASEMLKHPITAPQEHNRNVKQFFFLSI